MSATLLLGTIFILAESATALSIREILGLDDGDTEKTTAGTVETTDQDTVDEKKTKPVKPNTEPSAEKNTQTQLQFSELEKIVSVLDVNQRKALLGEDAVFKKFVQREANNKSILTAAKVNKVDKNEKTIFLTQRGVESIVREIYLNELIVAKIPADFPTEEQIKKYYEQNKDKLVLGERVHVWQIFLPIDENDSKKDIELVKKKAESITNDLKKGKLDFAIASQRYSGHEGSLTTGGYMGLVKVKDLKPEIQKPLMALAEGKISKPIRSDDGIHILKRGSIVPSQAVELDQIHDQIKQLLNKQIRQQLRNAIYEQASKTYPVDINDKKIEEWYLKLRTNLYSDTVTTSN